MACIRDDGFHTDVDFNTVMKAKNMIRELTMQPVRYVHDNDGHRRFYINDKEEAVACFDLWGNLMICGDMLSTLASNPGDNT